MINRKMLIAIRTITIIIAILLLVVAPAIYFYDNRPPEPTQINQINHSIQTKVIIDRQVVVREVSEIDWSWFTVTAYTQQDTGCNNITSIGINYDKEWTQFFEFVAVDPEIIPYGSTVFIKHNGDIVQALAVDTGGRIRGKRIDWYKDSLDEAYRFGVQELQVGIIKSREI